MSQLDNDTIQALRLAAVGALLHNLGKINAKFLDKQVNSAGNDYLYQHILGLIASHVSQLPTDWQNDYTANKLNASAILDNNTVATLKTAFRLPSPLDDRADYAIGDLIEYLGQGEPWYQQENGKFGIERIFSGGSRLTHLMNRAHRGASGGEKEDIATAQQPDAANLYLSTPFGYETAAPNINTINDLLQQIEDVIQQHLNPPTSPLALAEVITGIRSPLSRAIADTQRPLNDVTIGDIGHTGMAFLLTQAVEWILTKRNLDHAELVQKEADNTLFWRVLTVHTDGLRYLDEAASLADLRARRKQLQDDFEEINQKLEETLLAVEIYADEQRRLFVAPNLDENSSAYQTITDIVTAVNVDGLRLTSQMSDPVTNHPQDKGNNEEKYIGDVVLQQLQATPPYDFDAKTIAGFWSNHTNGTRTQICTACNLRPQGYGAEQIEAYKHNPAYYRSKAEGRHICCICMERRAGVAEKWASDELNTTVWLDEVADSNGRLALVVGQWNLESFGRSLVYPHSASSQSKAVWLHAVRFLNNPCPDGHTFTLNGQPYAWEGRQFTLSGQRELAPLKQTNLTIHAPSVMNVTVQDVAVSGTQLSLTVQEDLTSAFAVGSQVKCWGQDFRITDVHLLETEDDAGRQRILSGVVWDADYPFVVQSATKVTILEITGPGDGAKSESFARLRRIWQTTQKFWESALDVPNCDGKPTIPQVPHRLQIIPENREHLDLGHHHAYDLKLTGNVRLSVVWDSERKLFITCDNLDYLAKPERLGKPVIEFLKGELTLEEPSGYGSQNETWGQAIVEQAGEMPNSSYTPTIPILAQPRTFMTLVPADKALAVVETIHTKYEREMGKVRNRLPLHLGIVYFQRRTPLRSALDAGRRMLKYKSGMMDDEVWTVKRDAQTGPLPDEKADLAQGTQHFNQTVTVELEQNGRSLTWYVPAVMGDGVTPDNWYPYVFIQSGFSNPQQRLRTFKGLRPTGDNKTKECWLIHAGELKEGDQVYFTPATLDFQWLESAAQRFEIAYDEDGKRRDSFTLPYRLDQLDEINAAWGMLHKLSKSQLYALRDAVEEKRAAWFSDSPAQSLTDETFQRFCRDVVLTTKWPTSLLTAKTKEGKKRLPKDKADQLTAWAINGLLTDTIELHVSIMKEDLQTEEQPNE